MKYNVYIEKNNFLFNNSENIYICKYFWADQIAPRSFSKMMFLAWGIFPLDHSSKKYK